jgi:hypothetical protein
MKTSTAGKILVALAFASMSSGLFMGTAALGEDHDRRPVQENRGGHERDQRDNGGGRDNRGWSDNRGGRDNGGWDDNRGWDAYQPVYAPPPVVYAPSPSLGISLFFPLFR